MRPLFVSYIAIIGNDKHHGWVVLANVGPVFVGNDVEDLARRVEVVRSWPTGVVTIVSFQRLEEAF